MRKTGDKVKKTLVWLFLLLKRQLKKISLYVILFIMVSACVSVKHIADNYTVSISVGICNKDTDDVAKRVTKGMYEHIGLVKYVEYESEEELEKALWKKEIHAGYVINEEFSEKIVNAQTKDIIRVLETPDNMVTSISNELFFSYVMKEISYEWLVNDTKDTGLFDEVSLDDMRKELRKYFEINLSNGSTFAVNYDRMDDEFERGSFKIDITDYISPIIVGIIGLMVFIGGMCGTLNHYDDSESNAFILLNGFMRFMVMVIEIFIPVCIVTIFGITTLWMTQIVDNMAAVMAKFVIYDFIVVLYCLMLRCLIRKKVVFAGFIPVLVMMSLIFCPIFINMEAIAGELAEIGKILPLYWFYQL